MSKGLKDTSFSKMLDEMCEELYTTLKELFSCNKEEFDKAFQVFEKDLEKPRDQSVFWRFVDKETAERTKHINEEVFEKHPELFEECKSESKHEFEKSGMKAFVIKDTDYIVLGKSLDSVARRLTYDCTVNPCTNCCKPSEFCNEECPNYEDWCSEFDCPFGDTTCKHITADMWKEKLIECSIGKPRVSPSCFEESVPEPDYLKGSMYSPMTYTYTYTTYKPEEKSEKKQSRTNRTRRVFRLK